MSRPAIAEIKADKSKIRLEGLKIKSKNLLDGYPGYNVQWLALGLEDAKAYFDDESSQNALC